MENYKTKDGKYVTNPSLIRKLANQLDPSPYIRISPPRDVKVPRPEPVKKG